MWYVIHTEIGREELLRQRISRVLSKETTDNCKILYCIKKKKYLGQWHDERKRFLPGYMFLTIEDSLHALEIRKIFGDNNIYYNYIVIPMKQKETEFLTKLTRGRDEIGMSYGVIRNGVLKISDGVLMGMESRVKKIDRHKRKGYISMKLGEEEKLAEIGLEITEKTCLAQGISFSKDDI